MIPGQSPAKPHPTPPSSSAAAAPDALPGPNTGPDKVKGEFSYNDIVYVAGQWSRLYFYLRPVDGTDGEVSWIVRDCGCGGPKQYPTSSLVHKWHHKNGDSTP